MFTADQIDAALWNQAPRDGSLNPHFGPETKRAVAAFRAVLSRERAMAHRMNYRFSLVVLDLSGNRRNGELTQKVAHAFRHRLREVDVVGFLDVHVLGAILPQTPPEQAERVVRNVCDCFPGEDLLQHCRISVYPDSSDVANPNTDTRMRGVLAADAAQSPAVAAPAPVESPAVASAANASAVIDSAVNDAVANASGAAAANEVDVILSGRVPLWKRVIDVTVAVVALVAFAPIMAFEALLIKLVSPGPVLFRQRRVGHLGRPFDCLKFRTMHQGNDSATHAQHIASLIRDNAKLTKLDDRNDPRIIPFGRLLRASGLDELPQIINVLRGEMSLVGPRPCIQYEYRQFAAWQRRRCESPPGLTGLWQVNGKNRTTFRKMMCLDVSYVQHRSFWMDLLILVRTPVSVLTQVRDVLTGAPPAGMADGIRAESIGRRTARRWERKAGHGK